MVAERSAARRPGTGSGLQADSSAPLLLPATMSGAALVGAHWGHTTQDPVDGLARPVVGVRPQVRVGIQRLRGGGMPEPALHGLDRLGMPDEQ